MIIIILLGKVGSYKNEYGLTCVIPFYSFLFVFKINIKIGCF